MKTCKSFIMSKWLMFFFIAIITSSSLFAQGGLEIKGIGPDLYLNHTVAPKESIYSVGRLYNVAPKDLAAYNHLQMESGLSVGQEMKIPLDKNNFSQSEAKSGNDALVPVYHTVGSKETLYRLFVNYNKVPITSLQKWNNLQSDALSEGSQMIVGFLKVDKTQSALLTQQANTGQVASAPAQPEKKPEPAAEKPAVVQTPEPAKKETVAAPAKESVVEKTVNTKSSVNFSGGYFKKVYDQQLQTKSPLNNSGSGGTFKSTSGWQDGKYYCFYNDAAAGTVLKMTDNASGKSVYAKVLDVIPDIRQNAGLSVVLSNAAAEELGAGTENKFDCVVSYVK
jgi:LysM repeat protein